MHPVPPHGNRSGKTHAIIDASLIHKNQRQRMLAVPLLIFAMTLSRRNFLKGIVATGAYLSLASCEEPIHKAISHVIKPEKMDTHEIRRYATMFQQGLHYATLEAGIFEGKAVKMEGLTSPVNPNGASSAVMQAGLLDCYNPDRPKQYRWKGLISTQKELTKNLKRLLTRKKYATAFIYEATASPSEQKLIDRLCQKFDLEPICISALSHDPVAEAVHSLYGKRGVPAYSIEKAGLLIAADADFLTDWNRNFQLQAQYAKAKDRGLRHFQIEPVPTVSGAKAGKKCAADSNEIDA